MPSTTHPDWNRETEALEVAKTFARRVKGRTVVVTGVNAKGIGYTTAEAFASQGAANLILGGRNTSRIQECIDLLRNRYPDVNYRLLQVNLSSQASVRKAAESALSWSDIPAIHIVVNSAGIMNLPERILSDDGIEMHFATNHVGHFLFSCLIMPKLIQGAKGEPKGTVRIVNVSSLSPSWSSMRWSDMNFEKVNKDLPTAEQPPYAVHREWGAQDPENKSYLPLEGYNQSKVANLLFSIGANRRLYERHGILSLTVHPGVIRTELSRSAPKEVIDSLKARVESGAIYYKTAGAGAATSLTAALDPKLGVGEAKHGKENWGTFLADCQVTDMATPLAESNDEAEKLWILSETLVNQLFAW